MAMERTLSIIKPDATARNITGNARQLDLQHIHEQAKALARTLIAKLDCQGMYVADIELW